MIPLLDSSQKTSVPHIINPASCLAFSGVNHFMTCPCSLRSLSNNLSNEISSPVGFAELLCKSPSEKPTTTQNWEINQWGFFARTTDIQSVQHTVSTWLSGLDRTQFKTSRKIYIFCCGLGSLAMLTFSSTMVLTTSLQVLPVISLAKFPVFFSQTLEHRRLMFSTDSLSL